MTVLVIVMVALTRQRFTNNVFGLKENVDGSSM